MKIKIIIILIVISSNAIAQIVPSQNKLKGYWKFIPPKSGYDSIYSIFKKNKLIEISYYIESRKAGIYGNPFSYYGFWDSKKAIYPKKVADFEKKGNNMLFYDELGSDYDSLGNLFSPTRRCYLTYTFEGDDDIFLPSDYIPTKLFFEFTGRGPDIYNRITQIPLFVVKALKQNEKDWQLYKSFVVLKKIVIQKSIINSKPNIKTKMYLIKNDEVEIIEENDEWLKIRYYGKKTIEGWIKKSDIE
jgi:hypothetical protein